MAKLNGAYITIYSFDRFSSIRTSHHVDWNRCTAFIFSINLFRPLQLSTLSESSLSLLIFHPISLWFAYSAIEYQIDSMGVIFRLSSLPRLCVILCSVLWMQQQHLFSASLKHGFCVSAVFHSVSFTLTSILPSTLCGFWSGKYRAKIRTSFHWKMREKREKIHSRRQSSTQICFFPVIL